MARLEDGLRSLLILVAVLLVAGCSAAPGASSVPERIEASAIAPSGPDQGAPATLESAADGYTLTVEVDRTTIAPGDEVTFTATFANPTNEPIDYQRVGCDGAAVVALHVPIPLQPVGQAWDGAAAEFKEYTLTQGYGPGGVPATDPVRIELRHNDCDGGGFEDFLEPGGSITTRYTWPAEIVGGVSVLPGEIAFEVLVGYDRQNGPPTRDPNETGPPGLWIPRYKSLTVDGHLAVEGVEPHVVSAGQAIDAVLEDPQFAAWLARMPSSTWSNANLFLQSYARAEGIVPAGPSWAIELFRETGVPRNWAIAYVDPSDRRLLKVTYCNDPCDR